MKRIFGKLKLLYRRIYYALEFYVLNFFNVVDKTFILKRGKLVLPLSPNIKGNRRREEVYEPHTHKILMDELNKGMYVAECGASLGYFTVEISRLIGKEGKCFSFEPFPRYLRYLRKNISINALSNVKVVDKALGNSVGEHIIINPEDRTSYTSIAKLWNFVPKKTFLKNKTTPNSKKVEVIQLSDYLRSQNIRLDFLLIDIEGCEMLVFEDLVSNLSKDEMPKKIFFEGHKNLYGEKGLEKILNMLTRKGYKIMDTSHKHHASFLLHLK